MIRKFFPVIVGIFLLILAGYGIYTNRPVRSYDLPKGAIVGLYPGDTIRLQNKNQQISMTWNGVTQDVIKDTWEINATFVANGKPILMSSWRAPEGFNCTMDPPLSLRNCDWWAIRFGDGIIGQVTRNKYLIITELHGWELAK